MNKTELEYLSELDGILSQIDESAMRRTLGWVMDKYGKSLTSKYESEVLSPEVRFENRRLTAPGDNMTFNGCSTLADFISISHAKTNADLFLLSAYWFTKGDSEAHFKSSEIVMPLRNAGYEIRRTSNALDALKNAKPVAYMVQVGKNKGSRGHLTLKLTKAGIEAARRMFGDDIRKD